MQYDFRLLAYMVSLNAHWLRAVRVDIATAILIKLCQCYVCEMSYYEMPYYEILEDSDTFAMAMAAVAI